MPKDRPGKDNFDVHRTLPSRSVGAHRLSARNTPLEQVGPPPEGKRKGRSWKRLISRSLVSLILLVLIFFIVVGTWDAVELSHTSKKMFGSGNLFSLLFGDSLKTDSNGRVNILLAGYSADDPGHQGANLTDSIMLISLNKNTKTGYMLSIPRDLLVNLGSNNCSSGYQYCKINEAYEDGGMSLLERTVSQDFGVPINYYALIGYTAFRDTVNAVGGITINIHSSDPRGIYDPSLDYTTATCCALANYPNGPVTLNGKQALNLARARGDAYGSYGLYSDFDRTGYQREMLLAVKKKAISLRNIINPTKAGHLFDGVANNLRTDLDIGAALPLYSLFDSVNNKSMASYSLRDLKGKNYLMDYSGSLIPAAGINDYSQIQAAVAQLNQ